jgi:hypothetical protein
LPIAQKTNRLFNRKAFLYQHGQMCFTPTVKLLRLMKQLIGITHLEPRVQLHLSRPPVAQPLLRIALQAAARSTPQSNLVKHGGKLGQTIWPYGQLDMFMVKFMVEFIDPYYELHAPAAGLRSGPGTPG